MTRSRVVLTAFGKEVEKALIDRDMTKRDLAIAIGYTDQYLKDILRGNRQAIEVKKKIAKALDMDYISPKLFYEHTRGNDE